MEIRKISKSDLEELAKLIVDVYNTPCGKSHLADRLIASISRQALICPPVRRGKIS
ncbi:hypothetical protein [Anaerococcus tetradius]|uniref:hypothetical protein n=1 Tax=Anaerococcus tetradius TaxID=33036 RepID=UPI0023F3335E|nr:hypothetical protein [Anaerococcus tetradius]